MLFQINALKLGFSNGNGCRWPKHPIFFKKNLNLGENWFWTVKYN